MKKLSTPSILLLLTCCFLLLVSLASAQFQVNPNLMRAETRWTAVLQGAKLSSPNLALAEISKNNLALQLRVPGFEQALITRQNQSFRLLSIPGEGRSTEVGLPDVPLVRRLVAVPPGSGVRLNITRGNVKNFDNIKVLPTQEPLAEQGPYETPFKLNEGFYKQDTLYPDFEARVSEPMMLGHEQVVLLEMAPLRYNPSKQLVQVTENLNVELVFTKPATAVLAAPTGIKLAKINARAINPSLVAIGRFVDWGILPMDWDYLIITPEQFVDNLKPLVDWKKSKGLTVVTKTVESIGASVNAIRNYIRDAYEDHGINYVLLVGDTDKIPPYMFGSTPSDHYYSMLAGGDILPDVAVGRFAASTDALVDNMVAKSVNYEKSPTPSKTWYKKALLISDSGYFEDTSNWVNTKLTGKSFNCTKLYNSLGNANVTNVRNNVNGGVGVINYRGHGGQTGWGTSGFGNTNVHALTNGRMTPIIISPTCQTGWYDIGECYAEAWTRYASNSGAVCYWGSSRNSYGGYNDELCKGCWKAIYDDNIRPMGDVTNKAKLYMVGVYGTAGTAELEMYLFNLFGDPELNFWASAPASLVMPIPRVILWKPNLIPPKLMPDLIIKPLPGRVILH